MSHNAVRALRISFLAMLGTLAYVVTEHIAFPDISIWESHALTILFFTASTFLVTLMMLRREEESRSVLESRLQEISYLRLLIEQSRDGMVIVDPNYRVVETNQMHASMLGYTPEEMHQLCVWDWEAQFTQEQFWATFPQVKSEGASFETKHRRKDGSVYDAEVSVSISDVGGKTLSFCVTRDISVRKSVESALRESEEHFRQVVEGAPVGMYIQTDGIFRYFNPAALAMFGAESASQLVGQGFLEIIHPDSRAAVTERAHLVLDERESVPFLEERLLRVDGTVFDGEVTAVPFIFEGRGGALVFVRDITGLKREEAERRALEKQLQQAQKMEAVGRLAGGIAHDFNNLLMVIQSYTEMLQDGLPLHDGLRKNTEQVLKAAHRATSLTGQMLAFSRKQITSPVVLDLNVVIDETGKMLKRLIGEDIEFRVFSKESLWAISADSDQIVQILMNLCVNSRDAMPLGGMLTISTENIIVGDGSIEGHSCVEPGQYVKLSVTDTGTGISKEDQTKIFEPFFTTKEVGKGTGLGLAMVYGIVKQSGGYAWVDSEIGHGACFTICLPRAKGMVASTTSAKTSAQRRGTGTILIAEDDEALREAICGYLRTLGYTVLAASSGQHALSLASEYEGHIDLLITDAVMPKISGRELSQTLECSRPRLKTIHMSGYTDDEVLRHGIHDMDVTFLQKPFSLSTLARTVSDTLGRTETLQ
jgi:two-component system cell cycle sensor histidine kinase/response regulator CckA